MPVFGDGTGITHTDGSRIVWSTSRRPAILVPSATVTLTNFDIYYPDFSKSNAYGFTFVTTPVALTACTSFTSINAQEWDSGLSFVCNLPPSSNYFEIEAEFSRITTPSTYMDQVIPILIGSGGLMPDGNSLICEGIGPIVRMFSFERSGNTVQLRRKQSVTDNGGPSVPWNSPNNNDTSIGGYRAGFTYGGNPNAWPAWSIEQKSGGAIAKRRGESNACSLTDTSDYTSLYRGTVTVTPGYIAP